MEHADGLTQYASPHRSTPDTLSLQQAHLLADEGLCTLLDAMPELVMVLNENRQILFGNRTLREFALARECADYVGMRPGELLSCRSALTAECGCGTAAECRHCGAVEAILAALKGHKAAHECRVLCETSRGPEALDLKVWGTPLRWRGAQFVLLVALDISHEKRRRILERLFFHDILNTASTITMITELLMEDALPFDVAKNDLWQTAQTLVGEIRGQRELLAAECNELTVRFSLLDPAWVLESVAAGHRRSDAARGKRIAIVNEATDVQFLSDPILLKRVIANLLKNALEATEPGETVTLGCRCAGQEIAFWCHNTGEIPRDIQLQIFQRSFSTKGGGRGIGTYSIKLFTEKYLQGRVRFVSTAESGTVFTATFPVHPVIEEKSPA